MENPFVDAKSKTPKAKILLWGSYGTGKTFQALHFPAPAIVDMERGSENYTSQFDFKTFHATDPDKVMQGIMWLGKNTHDRKTVILDSMTEFWSALQKKWSDIFLQKNTNSVGNKEEFYELQPRDWATIKAEFKDFLRKMLDLDMHIVCTCREKTLYEEGKFLKKIGEVQDSDRSLPYLFDTVVRLEKLDGKHIAVVEKDRTQMLPKRFEVNYAFFAYAFELDGWDALVIPDALLPEALRGKGITGEMIGRGDASIVWDGKDKKGQPCQYKGRQLLHIWQSWTGQEYKLFSGRLLGKYPSKGKQAVANPDAEPAPDAAKAQS